MSIRKGNVVRLVQQGNPEVFSDGRRNRFTLSSSEIHNGLKFYRFTEISGLFLESSFTKA